MILTIVLPAMPAALHDVTLRWRTRQVHWAYPQASSIELVDKAGTLHVAQYDAAGQLFFASVAEGPARVTIRDPLFLAASVSVEVPDESPLLVLEGNSRLTFDLRYADTGEPANPFGVELLMELGYYSPDASPKCSPEGSPFIAYARRFPLYQDQKDPPKQGGQDVWVPPAAYTLRITSPGYADTFVDIGELKAREARHVVAKFYRGGHVVGAVSGAAEECNAPSVSFFRPGDEERPALGFQYYQEARPFQEFITRAQDQRAREDRGKCKWGVPSRSCSRYLRSPSSWRDLRRAGGCERAVRGL